jgi:hypothetical protein
MIFVYCIICFVLRIIMTFSFNWTNLAVISRKPWKSVYYSTITSATSWAVLVIVGKLSNWNVPIIIASLVGDAIADYIVAKRKIKSKHKKKNTPQPITSFYTIKRKVNSNL